MKNFLLVLVILPISILCYSDSKLVDEISWKDKGGSHIIRIIEESSGQYFESNWKSTILIEKKTLKKNISQISWDIKDFSKTPSETVNYIPKTLEIFDIDNDGIMESSFTYIIGTDGLDSSKIKQMVHKNNIKFAIRGELPKRLSDIDKYKFKIDSAFSTQSLELMIFSLNTWNRVVLPFLKKID